MRALRFVLVAALVGLGCGCSGTPIFEDVGVDLHRPSVRVLAIAYTPPDAAPGEEAPAPVFLPLAGFTIRANDPAANKFILQVSYADAGADIATFNVRDRNSGLNESKTPSAPQVDLDGDGILDTLDPPEFFVGTVGLANLESVEFPAPVAGDHVLEVWAEDSLESRSEKVVFTITVTL